MNSFPIKGLALSAYLLLMASTGEAFSLRAKLTSPDAATSSSPPSTTTTLASFGSLRDILESPGGVDGDDKSTSSSSGIVVSHPRRRAFLSEAAALASSVLLLSVVDPGGRALAAAQEEDGGEEEVYFGAGCFWHVQHEMTNAERTILGRATDKFTSRTGYAGGTKADPEGRVCYHNFQSVADYGKMGHGEVVGLRIPPSAVGDFAKEYFALFGDRGERADPMDKGGEYRSLLGLPGGRNHPMFDKVEAAATDRGMTLVDGRGDDPDTLGKRLVYVMDSRKFPFYQAEVYHQYHNDFLTKAYGKEYNDLVNAALDDGRIKITGCPNRVNNVKASIYKNGAPIISGGVICVSMIFIVLSGLFLFRWRANYLYKPIHERDERDDPQGNVEGTV